MTFRKSYFSSIFLMIRASFAFSVMALCVKLSSPGIPSMEIVFVRSILSVALLIYLIRRRGLSLWGHHRTQLLARGISGFLALSLHFYTIGRLPLGTAVLLNYTAPLFVVILSWFFLKEAVRLDLLAVVFICFGGVYMLLAGQTGGWTIDAFWGLLSAVFAAVAYITISTIRNRESPLTIIFYFTLVSSLGSLPFLFLEFRTPSALQLLYLLGVGAGAFLGQYWMTRALLKAPASLVSPFSYLTPLFSFLYGVALWGEKLSASSVLGMVLILGGGCLLSVWGAREKKLDAVSE